MGGHIPYWLYQRMKKMSLAIVESILTEYGHEAFLAKLSDPFWFQSFGAVIGFTPNDNFDQLLAQEQKDAWKYGGRTIKGFSKPPEKDQDGQLNLFE